MEVHNAEMLLSLQTEEPKLVPIQDVRTRWNSTFLMLRRAKRLQPIFDEFRSQYGHPHLMCASTDYLLYLTKPFFEFTTALSQTKDATIHSPRYLTILKSQLASLNQSKSPETIDGRRTFYAAKDKLSQYYNKIAETHNNLYAIGTILGLNTSLAFSSKLLERTGIIIGG
ncbi:hypothetical protein N7534_008094 [Penicillium rubens]|nr:hypothetical protein N7534_008094 [Penicillium rubens]